MQEKNFSLEEMIDALDFDQKDCINSLDSVNDLCRWDDKNMPIKNKQNFFLNSKMLNNHFSNRKLVLSPNSNLIKNYTPMNSLERDHLFIKNFFKMQKITNFQRNTFFILKHKTRDNIQNYKEILKNSKNYTQNLRSNLQNFILENSIKSQTQIPNSEIFIKQKERQRNNLPKFNQTKKIDHLEKANSNIHFPNIINKLHKKENKSQRRQNVSKECIQFNELLEKVFGKTDKIIQRKKYLPNQKKQ